MSITAADKDVSEKDELTAQEKREALKSSQQIVTFRLGSEEYGVDIMKVQEIILPGQITQVPEVPEFIEGVINLRGNVIPIIDLRKRFGQPIVAAGEETRIIVVNVRERTMGVIVDAVSEVLRIAQDEIDPPPAAIAGLGKEYLKGLIKLGKRLLILLEIEKILSLDELSSL